MEGWYVMYANEQNAEKGKCSYTRYNYFLKVVFKKKNGLGKPYGYLDEERHEILTPKNCIAGNEIYYWWPYVETRPKPDSDETETLNGYYRRAKLVRLQKEVKHKTPEEMTAEAFKALFDTDDLSTPSIDMSTVKEMIMKLLDDLDDTDLKAAQIKLNNLKAKTQISDRASRANDRENMIMNIIKKSAFSQHNIDDILSGP